MRVIQMCSLYFISLLFLKLYFFVLKSPFLLFERFFNVTL